VSLALPTWLPASLWGEFKKHRQKLKAPMTPYAEERAIAKLERLKTEGYNPIDVVNNSIDGGWKGLFPIKNGHDASAPKPKPSCARCGTTEFSCLISTRAGRLCEKCR
jgi:hypothetical protein